MNNVVRSLLRFGLKSGVEKKKYILDMVAVFVNFSHTMRRHITGQSKVKAIPVQALGVAVRAPTQNKVIFVMFSRQRVGGGTPFYHSSKDLSTVHGSSFTQNYVDCV